ncbi:probable RNA-directed DNA polymerase from transposon X-element [Trichonephila clavipes]|nr:probable RNA-directed DNA polymerase from transposon X-element [Trichonephila clavipes]
MVVCGKTRRDPLCPVCIFTSLDVPSSALPLHTSLQAVAVRIHSTSLITVCCLYLPPNTVIHQHDLNNLVDQLPVPFVILGDFNGHNTLWGSAKTNPRGRQIEQVLSDHCLCLLNHEEPTYFHEPTRSFHTLDLAICSPSLLPHLNLSIEKDLYNSDHFLVILSHDYDTGGKTFPPTYSYGRADWALFTQLAVIPDVMVKAKSVDTAVQEVTNVLIAAAHLSIPKSSGHSFQHYKPWWNADCQTAYKNQRKLWRIFRRYPSTENLLAFKKAKANARRVRRRSQRQSWIRYVSSLTSTTSSKQLWKKVKAANGIYREFSFPILQTSNSVFSSSVEIANILGETFQSVSSAASYNSRFLEIKRQAERTPINFSIRSFFPHNYDFTMTELKKALLQAHNTSSGPDGITYTMLRHLSPNSLTNILFLFNRVWKEHCFPSSWREATMIPILKPGKVATDPLSYRPIALTSCFCKTFEHMVNTRLVYVLEKEKCISPLQSGFRKGRSTLDNLVFLESQIRDAFVRRNHFVSLFFDREKAYDRTWRYGILRNMHDFGLRGNLPIFIFNFLAVRYFHVRIGHSSSHKFIQDQGVPQGSVLSVTLFNIHMSSILGHLPPSVRGILYVDDLQVSCQGSDMRLIERQLQTTVNRLVKWCDQNGHTISPSKSSCVHFCRKRNLHPVLSIHIGNIQIPVVSEVRFLGVIFDSKLIFFCMYFTCGRMYGSARASVLKRLDTVHHSALRICSGAFRTSPVTSLYVVCHQPPLELRRRQLSANYFIRAMSVPSHPLKPFSLAIGLTRLYEARSFNIKPFSERAKAVLNDAHLNNINIQENNILAFPPWDIQIFNFSNPFSGFGKTGTAAIIYQQLFSYHRNKFSKYIPVYTDGSKTAGHVGCGVVFNNTIFSFSLHNSMSVFSAELTAILIALQHILVSNHRHFCVYTDSVSTLESLHFLTERRHPTVIEILILLRKFERKGFDIIFSGVPGHVGILGNEQTDTAARSMSDHMQRPVCYQDLKTFTQNYIHRVWQETWDQQTLNKLHSIHPSTSHWAAQPVRRHDVRLTRLRIGHTRFTHKHLLLGENAPECPSCKVPYFVYHILIDCPVFNRHRVTFFHSSVLTLSDLVGETPHQNLFAFLLKIGFLHLI